MQHREAVQDRTDQAQAVFEQACEVDSQQMFLPPENRWSTERRNKEVPIKRIIRQLAGSISERLCWPQTVFYAY